MTNVQLCASGAGIQRFELVHTEVKTTDGRYPLLHWYVTVAPSPV